MHVVRVFLFSAMSQSEEFETCREVQSKYMATWISVEKNHSSENAIDRNIFT